MKEKKITKHCPQCDCEDLNYRFDIFEKIKYDEIHCGICNHKFTSKNIIIKEWVRS